MFRKPRPNMNQFSVTFLIEGLLMPDRVQNKKIAVLL